MKLVKVDDEELVPGAMYWYDDTSTWFNYSKRPLMYLRSYVLEYQPGVTVVDITHYTFLPTVDTFLADEIIVKRSVRHRVCLYQMVADDD